MYYCPSCFVEYTVDEADEKDYECCGEDMQETDSKEEDDDDIEDE